MKFAKKTDFILIGAILAACVALLVVFWATRPSGAVHAEIYVQSELVTTIDLSTAQAGRFSLDRLPEVVFELDGEGAISFAQSNCPDQVCVHAGKLHTSGEFAACLPNGVVVKIVSGEDTGGPDIVVQG